MACLSEPVCKAIYAKKNNPKIYYPPIEVIYLPIKNLQREPNVTNSPSVMQVNKSKNQANNLTAEDLERWSTKMSKISTLQSVVKARIITKMLVVGITITIITISLNTHLWMIVTIVWLRCNRIITTLQVHLKGARKIIVLKNWQDGKEAIQVQPSKISNNSMSRTKSSDHFQLSHLEYQLMHQRRTKMVLVSNASKT